MSFFHFGGKGRRRFGREVGKCDQHDTGQWRHRHRGRGIPLTEMENGAQFRVTCLMARGEIRQRLIDMGFIRGAGGKILREALLRDPIELNLQGSKISLRRAEAQQIYVEVLS